MLLEEADDTFPDAAVMGCGGGNKVPLDSFLFELCRCGFIVVDELLLECVTVLGYFLLRY